MPSEKPDLDILLLKQLETAKPYTEDEMLVFDDNKDPIRLLKTMDLYAEKLKKEGRTR